MQAIIMAAGKGSRLGELTGGNPKSFVEIYGKKLIEYNLDILKEIGVNEIFIVTGYRQDAFRELTKDMPEVQLIYNPFYEMVNVLGSFYMGMQYLKDDFLYLHADTLCDPAIIKQLAQFSADMNLPIDYKSCDEEAMKVRSQNGEIVQITKNIPIEEADGEFIGIASFRENVIPQLKIAVENLLEEKKFSEYFEAAIQRLLDTTDYSIKSIPMGNAFWAEIDFKEDYERAVANIPEYMYKSQGENCETYDCD